MKEKSGRIRRGAPPTMVQIRQRLCPYKGTLQSKEGLLVESHTEEKWPSPSIPPRFIT